MKKLIGLLVIAAIMIGSLGFRSVSASNPYDDIENAYPAPPAQVQL